MTVLRLWQPAPALIFEKFFILCAQVKMLEIFNIWTEFLWGIQLNSNV